MSPFSQNRKNLVIGSVAIGVFASSYYEYDDDPLIIQEVKLYLNGVCYLDESYAMECEWDVQRSTYEPTQGQLDTINNKLIENVLYEHLSYPYLYDIVDKYRNILSSLQSIKSAGGYKNATN